jgi:NADH:ubiquinone oxidoreductase subunit E
VNHSVLNEKTACNCGGQTGSLVEVEKVSEIIKKHCNKNGALMPILNDIQDAFGYLPQTGLKQVSKELDISMAEIYGVATFYSRFTLKPRGEHTVSVCLGTACYVRGAKSIYTKLIEELKVKGSGDTTDDGKFTLEATRCLGCCGLAPVMMIDDEVYGKLTPEKIPEILKKY